VVYLLALTQSVLRYDGEEKKMADMKCVEIVVKEKPGPLPEEKPKEKIPLEYLALGAGIAVPVVGVLIFTEMRKK